MNHLWNWLTYRLGAKALALGVALGLWMAVAGQQSAEMALTVPIEYQRIAAGVELRGEIPAEVTIRLRGSQLALAACAPALYACASVLSASGMASIMWP